MESRSIPPPIGSKPARSQGFPAGTCIQLFIFIGSHIRRHISNSSRKGVKVLVGRLDYDKSRKAGIRVGRIII